MSFTNAAAQDASPFVVRSWVATESELPRRILIEAAAAAAGVISCQWWVLV
jgi:hypothetical protein